MPEAESTAPIGRVHGVTLDVNDLDREKAFWGAALGKPIYSEVDGWAAFEIFPGFVLDLQRVPEGKASKNRFHFDVTVPCGEEGIRRLEELGAVRLEHVSTKIGEWYVMGDPEGNEFCAVIRHRLIADLT